MGLDDVAALRLAIFASVYLLLAGCEVLWAFRSGTLRAVRWPTNLGLSIINTLAVRLLLMLVPGLALVSAASFENSGLLAGFGLQGVFRGLAGFLLLDLAVYLQHRTFHAVPMLWRVHRVHHADLALDVSSGVRFHPIEILLSFLWKYLVVMAAGIPAMTVIVFEIVLNASSMFSHANFALPREVERVCRKVIVTPDMHRIHHSIERRETDTNFGFNFSIWDRLFGSYVELTKSETALLGLESYRGNNTSRAGWLLRFPFLVGPAA